MTDPRETPDLLVPDHRVMSLDEARAEKQDKQATRPPGRGNDIVYRRDFDKWMTQTVEGLNHQMTVGMSEGLLALGQKMYDQWGDESVKNLEEMEVAVYRRVWAQIENDRRERSWRRRARRLLAGLGWKEPAPMLVAEPAPNGPERWQDGAVHEEAHRTLQEQIMRESEDAALEEAMHDGD